jgi:OmpA-OmpF porin, OOP family
MKFFCVIFLISFVCNTAHAQKDVSGSKDHPVVSRFYNSRIRFYDYKKFDQYRLRESSIIKGSENKAKYQTLEGEVTRIIYQCPKNVGAFELYQSYTKALQDNGFKKKFTCENAGCGDGFGRSYPSDNAPHILSYTLNQRYFSCKRTEADGKEIYVSVYTVQTQDGAVARLDIIEIKKMEEDQVKVSAAKMKSEFEVVGKAVINQIYFESGKAVLQPSSAAAVKEVAVFLQNNPSLNIFVVGHTDSDGGFDFNMNLSQKRAEAVVKELTQTYQINPGRLSAKGVGYLCPVVSNENEKDRAKNRRVELVKQ